MLEIAKRVEKPDYPDGPSLRNENGHWRMLQESFQAQPQRSLGLSPGPGAAPIQHYNTIRPALDPIGLDIVLPMRAVRVDEKEILAPKRCAEPTDGHGTPQVPHQPGRCDEARESGDGKEEHPTRGYGEESYDPKRHGTAKESGPIS